MTLNRKTILWLAVVLVAASCATGPKLTSRVKSVDPDRTPAAKPRPNVEYREWDFIDHTLVYQVGKTLDLDYTGQRLGGAMGLGDGRQADNVNTLDEVCESSWYANRHHHNRMTAEELMIGPGRAVPDTSGQWEIVSGKSWGVSAGFNIRDTNGQVFVIKFDTRAWPEMASSAEVISTKFFHAAGYNVPVNSVITFLPARVFVGRNATIRDADGTTRLMTEYDLDAIWKKVNIGSDGRVRAVSSVFLPGEPIGPFRYHGRRRDDPNDRVMHEHRRELRGLRVLSSWLNDADRRTANTLDMYVPVSERLGFVKHYIIDMGSTLGSNSRIPHLPRYGNAYLWSVRDILKKTLSLGFHTNRWDTPQAMEHPTIGYFENDTFRPGEWVTAYPNPAFQWCTNRDGFWGARIVTAFTDADIAAIVKTGKLSSAAAETELTRLLIERRDIIGRYWFGRTNPLDRFSAKLGILQFEDLAITRRLADPLRSHYRYRHLDQNGRPIGTYIETAETLIPIRNDVISDYQGFEIQTGRPAWGKTVRVYVHKDSEGASRVVRIDREE